MDVDHLFDALHAGLVRFALRMTGDLAEAEDAARDAFVRFLDERPRGDTHAVRVWLYRALARRLREAGTRGHHAPGRRLPAHLDSRRPPTDPRDQAMLAVLATLPEPERAVLLLREEGLSHREVAEVAGVPLSGAGGVGELLVHARRRFGAALPPEGPSTQGGAMGLREPGGGSS